MKDTRIDSSIAPSLHAVALSISGAQFATESVAPTLSRTTASWCALNTHGTTNISASNRNVQRSSETLWLLLLQQFGRRQHSFLLAQSCCERIWSGFSQDPKNALSARDIRT